MKIRFKYLSIRNFMSFGNNPTIISLENRNGATIIVGENGVGKTTILNALTFALYDKPLPGPLPKDTIGKDDLVNNINKKNMEVIVVFEKGGIEYKIVRQRKMKGDSSLIYFSENGADKTVSNTNAEIEKIIGLTYELFVRIVVFSASHQPFLNLPVTSTTQTSQTSIIEELFDLTTLTDKAELLKASIKDTDRRIETHTTKIEALKIEHERHSELLKSAEQRVIQWTTQTQESISKLNNQIKTANDIDIAAQKLLFEKQAKLLAEQQTANHVLQTTEGLLKKEVETVNQLTADINQLRTTLTTLEGINTEEQKEFFESKVDLVAEQQTLTQELKDLKTTVSHETETLDKLKTEQQSESNWIARATRDIKSKQSQISTTQQEIDHLRENKCPLCKQSIKDGLKKIKEYEITVNSLSEAIEQEYVAVTEHSTNLDNIETQIGHREGLISEINIKIASKEPTLSEIVAQIKAIERVLVIKTLDEIYNLQNQVNLTQSSIKTLSQQFDDVNIIVSDLNKELTLNKSIVSTISVDLKEVNGELLVSSVDDLYALQTQVTTLTTKLEELSNAINPFIEPLEELQNVKIEAISYTELNELDKLLDHQKFLLKLLTKKDSFVRKTLLNKSIPYLNNRLQHYLSIIGLPHKVEFTHELTASISQFGRALQFGNLSTGQKARVNLALSFAFRDVLQSIHTNINVCMLDEVLDVGLDAAGVQAAASMLKRTARDEQLSLFIISHRSEIENSFDNLMTVKMVNSFSNVTENTLGS